MKGVWGPWMEAPKGLNVADVEALEGRGEQGHCVWGDEREECSTATLGSGAGFPDAQGIG